jgi:hypothetical protein
VVAVEARRTAERCHRELPDRDRERPGEEAAGEPGRDEDEDGSAHAGQRDEEGGRKGEDGRAGAARVGRLLR